MSIFNNLSLLELVEALAAHESLPDCEQDVSDRYDSMLNELEGCEACGHNKALEMVKNDEVALNEDFSNFKDMLCSDGTIHSEQVSQYEYVGEYS